MSKKITQTAGRTQLEEFAPMFAHLNDDVLFGEVWHPASQIHLWAIICKMQRTMA